MDPVTWSLVAALGVGALAVIVREITRGRKDARRAEALAAMGLAEDDLPVGLSLDQVLTLAEEGAGDLDIQADTAAETVTALEKLVDHMKKKGHPAHRIKRYERRLELARKAAAATDGAQDLDHMTTSARADSGIASDRKVRQKVAADAIERSAEAEAEAAVSGEMLQQAERKRAIQQQVMKEKADALKEDLEAVKQLDRNTDDQGVRESPAREEREEPPPEEPVGL